MITTYDNDPPNWTPIYTAPDGLTVMRFYFQKLGATHYAIIYLSDDSVVFEPLKKESN